ncbi:MAG: general stress protein CsbD [Proteobacteria bacterium]|nr:general stress protein CsbD [Pseudomonadota bacterium]
MDNNNLRKDWSEVKTKLKARFGKLTDETIDSLKGNLDTLSSKLQSTYGYAKEQADKEFAGFKDSLDVANNDMKNPPPIDAKNTTSTSAKHVS